MNARRLTDLLATIAGSFLLLDLVAGEARADSWTNNFNRTVSASRQFAAYANDQLLPSALCVYAERVKREWLRRLDLADQWRDPILMVVRSRAPTLTNAPAISLGIFQTDSHLKYQVECLVPPPLDESALLAKLVETLSSEFANRDQPIVRSKAYIAPRLPGWLVTGLAASIQGRSDSLLSIARRSVAAGRPLSATHVLNLEAPPTDEADRQLFEANAWMFTESLFRLPDGSRKLRQFLVELGAQKIASNAFWAVYHQDFPQDAALEKWWSLQQMQRIGVGPAENLAAHETARRLEAILITRLGATTGRRGLPDDTTVRLDELWRYSEQSWLQDVLKMKIDQFGALRSLAHPLYRPVLDEYIAAVQCLVRRNTVRFRRAIQKADKSRAAADTQSHKITEYMNQAERVYAPEELSQIFTGYFRTLDQFHKLDDGRTSPIGDYLDKFDR